VGGPAGFCAPVAIVLCIGGGAGVVVIPECVGAEDALDCVVGAFVKGRG
jgi:hypothetical protein